jgi:hypothetical protein
MKVSKLAVGALGLAAAASLACADVMPYSLDSMGYPESSGRGYNGRTGAPIRGVVAGDIASMCMVMMDGSGHATSINASGECNVQRGSTFTDLGQSRNGNGHILATWDEVVSGNLVYVNAIYKTSDGSQFMPVTAMVNGQPAYFWTWRMGMQDPVNFQPFVTSVTLNAARVYFSDTGGQSFTSSTDITSNLNTNWNPGRDPGLTLASIGDGTNFMLLSYQITVVPAPAGLGAMAGASLLALRRRRR